MTHKSYMEFYIRSNYIDKIETDELRFRNGNGVAYTLINASISDYDTILGRLHIDMNNTKQVFGSSNMHEIMENKWLLHAYDLYGNLN